MLVGGLAVKVLIDDRRKVNVMPREIFREFREGKYKFFSADHVPILIEGSMYSGVFTTNIKVDEKWQNVHFFVENSSRKEVLLSKKMAIQLKLISNIAVVGN